jgi:hypothetical protein
MGVLTDLEAELEAYPETYVDLEFVDVVVPGDVLNVNEEVMFKLQVHNRGPLTLTDLRIRFAGKNGTKVKGNGAIAQFASEAFANTIDRIQGHNGENLHETEVLWLKAPPGTKAVGTDLVEAFVEEYNADVDHLLVSHTRPSTSPNGVYESQVRAA